MVARIPTCSQLFFSVGLIYPVLYCCTTYGMPSMVYSYKVVLPLLLLLCAGVVAAAAVALRRHVPDGKRCCWFTQSDSIQGSISFHLNTNF